LDLDKCAFTDKKKVRLQLFHSQTESLDLIAGAGQTKMGALKGTVQRYNSSPGSINSDSEKTRRPLSGLVDLPEVVKASLAPKCPLSVAISGKRGFFKMACL